MANLKMIEGIGEAYFQKLAEAGLTTTESLLARGATKKGREEIAVQSGISEKLILAWVNHCDLYRLDGAGEEYIDLLEAAGVDSVPELAQRSPENLHKRLEEVNAQQNRVRNLPNLNQVSKWVEQAKTLPRVVTH